MVVVHEGEAFLYKILILHLYQVSKYVVENRLIYLDLEALDRPLELGQIDCGRLSAAEPTTEINYSLSF